MKEQKVGTDKVVNNFIDPETGEILDTVEDVKHHKIVVATKEEFYWTYSAILGIIDSLSKTEMKLLYWACLNAQFNKNIIGLGKPICADIEKTIDLSYQTIKDTISSLKAKNVLIAQGSGYYRINPRYYWKGGSAERLKTMKYILEVECPECLTETELKVAAIEENTEFLTQKSE